MQEILGAFRMRDVENPLEEIRSSLYIVRAGGSIENKSNKLGFANLGQKWKNIVQAVIHHLIEQISIKRKAETQNNHSGQSERTQNIQVG